MNRLVYILLLLLSFSCRKDDLNESTENDPQLFVHYNHSSTNGEFIAGEKGIYNSASYNDPIDSINVGAFISAFSDKDNEANLRMIEFRFRNFEFGELRDGSFDNTFTRGYGTYYQAEVSSFYKVSLSAHFPNTVNNVVWDLGDGTSMTDSQIVKYYPIEGPNKYRLKLNSSCGDEIESDLPMPSFPFSYAISREAIDLSENIYRYYVDPAGSNSHEYIWTFDNNLIVNTAEAKIDYAQNEQKIEHVKLDVKDSRNNTLHLESKFNIGSNPTCFSNILYSIDSIVEIQDLSGLKQIEVIYIDESGKEFSSFYGKQNSNSYFNIVDHFEYIKNERGQNTRVIEIDFACTIFSSDNDSIVLENGFGKIAVAHP